MPKMHRIEKLIEAEVPRQTLPEELGAGPVWKTTSSSNFKKKRKFKPNPRKKD